MTHELKQIIHQFEKRRERAVLATVVALDGSSYRRPGVRMLLFGNGDRVGSVSGGCVEKEIHVQAASVFSTGHPKVMAYDGRYRLGCEGILYILLEPFLPGPAFLERFWESIHARKPFTITCFFKKEVGEGPGYHSLFDFSGDLHPLGNKALKRTTGLMRFQQPMAPCFQLLILGAEHDAVQLCQFAALAGWEVTVVANPREEKTQADFPGVHSFLQSEPEAFVHALDLQTAVMVMTHSFVKDLGFTLSLSGERAAYFGLLGPTKRRERLLGELLERQPEVSEAFLATIHAPAGIDIGAETPQEIALSILSEIIAIRSGRPINSLKYKGGKIHS